MRNIFLSLVLVAVLVSGGVGGAFAGWSDSEISYDNYVETGSLDLKVNDADDLPWGTGVPTKIYCECVTPCCENCWGVVELHNAGQCCAGAAYMHFKEICCADVPPEKDGYISPTSGILCPEPELVAQFGGMVDQVEVPGIGDEPCFLSRHIDVTVIDIDTGEVYVNREKIADVADKQIYIRDLEACQTVRLLVVLHLQQIEDPDWEARGLPEKFKDWPSNALMKDAMLFNIEFDLLQIPKPTPTPTPTPIP